MPESGGKTNRRGLLSSLRLQPERFTEEAPALYSSIQSGNALPFVTAPALSAMISLSRTGPSAGGAVRLPGEPLLLALARQLAGSSGSPSGSMISSDGPLPFAADGQPFLSS